MFFAVAIVHIAGHGQRVRPPSTGRLIPLMYAAAGLHRNAMAAPISWASPNRFSGTAWAMPDSTSAAGNPGLGRFRLRDLGEAGCAGRTGEDVVDGNAVRAEFVGEGFGPIGHRPRTVFDTPNPSSGCLTDVEITLTMRPSPAARMPGSRA